MLGYLTRLSNRMDNRGMGTEPLAASERNAQHAMQELRTALHYSHCDGLGERASRATKAFSPPPHVWKKSDVSAAKGQ
jgi:hypothetical protein